MLELALLTKLCWLTLGGLGIYLGVIINVKSKEKIATSRLGKAKDLIGLLGTAGINLSQNIQLSEKASFEHPIIIGPTGAGKTTALFLPNLLSNNLRGSIIVSDPKGELYKLTHKYQESIGRKTILFKPLEQGTSYNPLKNCKNDREIIKLAQTLLINGALSFELQTGKKTNGVEWIQMSQSLLTAALFYVKDIGSIQNALELIISHDNEELDQIFNNAKQCVKTQYNAFKMCLDSPKTMGSIKITLSSNLSLFMDNLPIKRNDFTANDLRKQETILYVSYPENMAYYLSPFTAPFYSQLIDHLIDSYTEDSNPIYFMFDEFANIGMLSAFSLNIASARSRKIGFTLCLQSITQLIQIYGRENALAILNNAKTKIILPGISDIETLRYCSDLCGETEITYMENGKTIRTKKPLFTHDEIRRLPEDEMLIISGNRLPIKAKQDIYYKHDKYKNNVEV